MHKQTHTHTLHEYIHTHVKSRKANEESHCCANAVTFLHFLTIDKGNMWLKWPPRLVRVRAEAVKPVTCELIRGMLR